MIYGSKTKKPYIDADGGCYLFETKSAASDFANRIEDTYVENAKAYKQTEFCNEFYGLGIKKIIVNMKSGDTKEIPLSKKDVPRGFYNAKCNFAIQRLRQTRQKQYLRELKTRKFLTPAMVEPRAKAKCPVIKYCYAYVKDGEKMFILFSTLDEFNEWNEKKGKKIWKPLNIEFKNFDRIRKKNTVVINPLSDKLILSNAQVSAILKMEK